MRNVDGKVSFVQKACTNKHGCMHIQMCSNLDSGMQLTACRVFIMILLV